MTSPVEAYVAVGSNIDPERNISIALDLLSRELRLAAVSMFYWSRALGNPGLPDYLNGVVGISTSTPPDALKYDVLRGIESRLGRVRSDDKFAPRCIDLDVILWGDTVMDTERLKLPDPDIRNRPFIAAPLLELAPGLILPDRGGPLSAIVAAMRTDELVPNALFTETLRGRFIQ